MTTPNWQDLPPVPAEQRPVLPEGWQPRQTFLRLHDRCDRAAMLYLLFDGGASSIPMHRGLVVHEVIARLTRIALEQGEGRIESPEVGKDVLLEFLAENPHLQISAAERDACRYMVHNFCMHEVWDPQAIVALETTLSLEIGGYTVSGRIDRAEAFGNEIEVVDYKTGWAPDREEFKPQSFSENGEPRFAGHFQTQLYALLLAFGTFPDGQPLGGEAERFHLRLVYPRQARGGALVDRRVTIGKPQLLDFRLDVEAQLERLRTTNLGEGRWQPTPGTVCRECPAKFACPLPAVLRPEAQLADSETIEDLERLATAAWFMSARGRELKARVKKQAERLEEVDPDALVLPDGERGVRIGTSRGDEAFVFYTEERQTTSKGETLIEAIETAKANGEFDYAEHFRTSTNTRFEKKKVPPMKGTNGNQGEG